MLDTAQQVGITTQERGNEEGGTERLRAKTTEGFRSSSTSQK